jgi:hypothetical protein
VITYEANTSLVIPVVQGAQCKFAIVWRDSSGDLVDITGATALFRARIITRPTSLSQSYSKASTVIALTHSSGVTIGGANGTTTVRVPGSTTKLISPGMYDFDLELTLSSVVTKISSGQLWVKQGVNF